jgi:hypothetical protein
MVKQRLYRIFVNHPIRGWTPLGLLYRSRESANGWLSFARSSWHCPVKVLWVANETGVPW